MREQRGLGPRPSQPLVAGAPPKHLSPTHWFRPPGAHTIRAQQVQTQRIRLVTPVLAFALSACASAAQSTPTSPRPSASQLASSPVSTRLATRTPRVTVVDAAYVADELGTAEQAIRNPDPPPSESASLGQRQQLGYHRLAAHPDWVPVVLNAAPALVRSAIQD